MNNRVIVNMGLPMDIRNADGKKATIELNKSDFVVCRYHPANSVYLQDAVLSGWYPRNWFKKLVYNIKVKTMRNR